MDKLNTKRRGKGKMERMNFTVDPIAKANFEKLKAFYQTTLNKEVSISLIIRRAMEALVDHTNGLHDDREIQRELLTLLKQAG